MGLKPIIINGGNLTEFTDYYTREPQLTPLPTPSNFVLATNCKICYYKISTNLKPMDLWLNPGEKVDQLAAWDRMLPDS